MHSHHSHSGEFVSHATGTLEEMALAASNHGFTTFCLTEHMPRLEDRFLYPEEIEKDYTIANLAANFEQYLVRATQIKDKYLPMRIVVGFEVEGLNQAHIDLAKDILKDPRVSFCVGSVHHVHEVPIDFSAELWLEAQQKTSSGTARSLYRDYFDMQYAVLDQLEPLVVGHFDLIRLYAPKNQIDPTTGKLLGDVDVCEDWPDVWEAIERNIKRVVEYGGLFELNSAAIRKGWATPYPKPDIAQAIVALGGRFCLSDDSHGVDQVGLNYHKVWEYLGMLGVEEVWWVEENKVRKHSIQ